MSKAKGSDELRPEYKREDLGAGVRGKYFDDYNKGTNLVLLSPEVARVFTTAEAVNDALRSLINKQRNRQVGQFVPPDRPKSGLPGKLRIRMQNKT